MLVLAALARPASVDARQTLWKFDSLTRIGGFKAQAEGNPRLEKGPNGRAIRFDGDDDSVLIDGRPLVGAGQFTLEVIFRPEGGQFEQRFLHIAETDPATGLDAQPRPNGGDPNARFMFEIRVEGDSWYLDTFVSSKAGSKPLIFPDRKYPLGRWYAVAQTYDGKTYRAYVDGVEMGSADIPFTPHKAGRVRVGARINKVSFFRGSVARARFTDRALRPAEMMKAAN